MRILQLPRIVAVVGISATFGLAQDASSFKTLYSFTGQPDGANPWAGVVIAQDGGLYGTTSSGGTSNLGTVFELVPSTTQGASWTETVLHDFTGSDGANPWAGVVIAKGGVLYGTTHAGGTSNSGTVFRLMPPSSPGGAWTERVLHDFAVRDGFNPAAGVVIGSGGVLYGTTSSSGPSGTVFSLTPPAAPGGAWTEAELQTFESNDGAVPFAGLVIGSGGVLYGKTIGTIESRVCLAPDAECGVVYSLTPPLSPGSAWTETLIYNLPCVSPLTSPGYAGGGVAIGSGGVLYGTDRCGGGDGTVFSLTPPASPGGAWTETTLYSFNGGGSYGALPLGVVIGPNGVLYGTTYSGGTSNNGSVFSLTPPASPGGAWTESVLHDFTGGGDGSAPQAGLVISKNGVLYGTTSSGGASNAGTVFELKP
jgi:uncharacterized repeat protein (TIGR03803 family)